MGTARRWTPLLPSVLAVSAAVAGLVWATAATRGAGGPRDQAVPLPSPHSIVRNGTRYVVRPEPVAAAGVDRTGRNLTLYVFAMQQSSSPACNWLAPQVKIVGQDAGTVRVAGFSYRMMSRGRFGCSFFMSCDHPVYATLHARLRAPLGERLLVDADSGAHVAVMHGQRAPRATYVPPGYRPTIGRDLDGRRLRPPCTVSIVRSYVNGSGSSFNVWFGSATEALGLRHRTGGVDVNGHAAQLLASPYERCVGWEQPVGLLRQVCTPLRRSLPMPELLKVARGLR